MGWVKLVGIEWVLSPEISKYSVFSEEETQRYMDAIKAYSNLII